MVAQCSREEPTRKSDQVNQTKHQFSQETLEGKVETQEISPLISN